MVVQSGIVISLIRIHHLRGSKLGCSSKTCNEAIWGDMGLETLKSRRDRSGVCRLPYNRYPKQLLSQEGK